VQQEVLTKITGPELSIYSVWVPTMAGDRQEEAQRATAFLSDDRVKHYWAPDLEIANSFRDGIGLAEGPVWDVYLLYGPESIWQDAAPKPHFFMHQLWGLPEEHLLNGDRLLEKTKELIAKQAQPAEKSSPPTESSTG
jgi:hypothetical protein